MDILPASVPCGVRPAGALRRLANADDPNAVAPASVKKFATHELGQGLKVLRFGSQPGKRRKAGKVFGALG